MNATNCFNSTNISFNYITSRSITDQGSETAPENSTSTGAASSTTSRSHLFPSASSSTCAPCPTQTACPSTNGNGNPISGMSEGLGMGFPLGVLALGVLGL